MIPSTAILKTTIKGTGRAFIILFERNSGFEKVVDSLAELLQTALGQICTIELREIANDWRQAVADLNSWIDQQAIRNASFIAFKDAAVLAQALCLTRPRLVRTLVLIDGCTRAHPSKFIQLIERVEKFLPLGLPFRSDFPGFDGKPFLQRIRCPVLVGLTSDAEQYRKEQALILVEGMPTSFLIEFKKQNLEAQIANAIKEFQEIPAKVPQKNLRAM